MVVKHFYSVLIAFVLLLLTSAHMISGADERGDSQSIEQNTAPILDLKNFIEEKKLGTLENRTWWFDPPENKDEKDFLGNLLYGLELYKEYLSNEHNAIPQELGIDRFNYGYWSLKHDDLLKYFDSNEKEWLRILKDYPVTYPRYNVPFEKYVELYDLGEVDDDGVWNYTPPEKLSEKAPLTRLSYGLKSIENYADEINIDPWNAITSLKYGDWSLNQEVLQDYFQSPSTFEQSIILGEYLNP